MNVFSKNENKTRVAFYPRVSFNDSCHANPARPPSHSKKRQQKRKALINQYKQNNDRYIKNLSDITLTDQDKTLLSNGLKFIPTPPKPNSHRSLIKDFNNFTRNMRLKFLFADCNSKPHLFHVKSNWQPPPQPSVALENYLERTRYMRLLQYRSAIRKTIYQQKNENPSRKLLHPSTRTNSSIHG